MLLQNFLGTLPRASASADAGPAPLRPSFPWGVLLLQPPVSPKLQEDAQRHLGDMRWTFPHSGLRLFSSCKPSCHPQAQAGWSIAVLEVWQGWMLLLFHPRDSIQHWVYPPRTIGFSMEKQSAKHCGGREVHPSASLEFCIQRAASASHGRMRLCAQVHPMECLAGTRLNPNPKSRAHAGEHNKDLSSCAGAIGDVAAPVDECWSNRDHPSSENTWSQNAMRQVPHWHCWGWHQHFPNSVSGEHQGCRSPLRTKAKGQEAEEEEEKEAAGLVTP